MKEDGFVGEEEVEGSSSSCQPESGEGDRRGDDDLAGPLNSSPERTRASISAPFMRIGWRYGSRILETAMCLM